jgi:hypothetical protein
LVLAFELGVALLERAEGRVGSADRALSGGAFGIAVPLLAYLLVARACASLGLRDAVLPLARHGAHRQALVVGLAVPPALLAGLFAAFSGLAVVLTTRGIGDPLLLRDVATCLWIGIISGLGYTLAFVGASAFGKAGSGRAWLLAADFLLGAGSSGLAAPWPRAHVRNLLGGTPVLELSQLASLLLLLGTSFAFLALGLRKSQA